MKFSKPLSGLMCALATLANVAVAGEKEDVLISKVIAAYGGDKLISAKALTINDRYKVFRHGQGYKAGEVDIEINNVSLTIDFENKRKSIVDWRKISRGAFLSQYIHDGKAGHALNHSLKTHRVNANANYNAVGNRVILKTDTALVRLLSDAKTETKYGGIEMYRGIAHEKLTYKLNGGQDLTIYINKETGLLSQMIQQSPQRGELRYAYSEHRKQGGITYASDTRFLVAGQPSIITASRSIELNPNLDNKFDLPNDYAEPGAVIDTSEMLVKKLADDVYYVGKDFGYSVFVDAGDHFVGTGGYKGLTDRLKAAQALAGNEKPLRDHIITHHHEDHLGAGNEIAELGANFVTVDSNIKIIKDLLTHEVPDSRFVKVNGKQTFGNGKVEVFDISTAHADHYLLYYVPSAKLVFSADHFFTDQETGLPPAHNNMVTFRHAIEALGIDVEKFVSAHGVRTLTMADLRKATEGYVEATCLAGISICAD